MHLSHPCILSVLNKHTQIQQDIDNSPFSINFSHLHYNVSRTESSKSPQIAFYTCFSRICVSLFERLLRWLKTVSNTYIWMGRYNHSLSLLDATIMVSKNCLIIGEDVGIIFVTQYVTIATV